MEGEWSEESTDSASTWANPPDQTPFRQPEDSTQEDGAIDSWIAALHARPNSDQAAAERKETPPESNSDTAILDHPRDSFQEGAQKLNEERVPLATNDLPEANSGFDASSNQPHLGRAIDEDSKFDSTLALVSPAEDAVLPNGEVEPEKGADVVHEEEAAPAHVDNPMEASSSISEVAKEEALLQQPTPPVEHEDLESSEISHKHPRLGDAQQTVLDALSPSIQPPRDQPVPGTDLSGALASDADNLTTAPKDETINLFGADQDAADTAFDEILAKDKTKHDGFAELDDNWGNATGTNQITAQQWDLGGNESAQSRHINPDSQDTAESQSFTKELGAKTTASETLSEPQEEHAAPVQTSVAAWNSASESTEGLEDSWAKALGSPGDELGDAWGAAFGDELDGEFLEDLPPVQSQPPPNSTSTQQSAHNTQKYALQAAFPPSLQRFGSSSYDTQPVHSPPVRPTSSSTNADFFAELPVAQPPRRRPKPPAASQPSPSSMPPPQYRSAPPSGPSSNHRALPPVPGQGSGSLPSTMASQFRGPERLELFPPQPSVTSPSGPQKLANSQYAPETQPLVPVNSRYSPSMSQIPVPGSTYQSTTSQGSQYSPIPPPVANAQSHPPQLTAAPAIPAQQPVQTSSRPELTARSSSKPRYSPAPANFAAPLQAATDSRQAAGPGAKYINNQTSSSGSTPPPPRPYAPRTSSPLAQPQSPPKHPQAVASPKYRTSETRVASFSTPSDAVSPSSSNSAAQLSYDALPMPNFPKRTNVPSMLHGIPESPTKLHQGPPQIPSQNHFQFPAFSEKSEPPKRSRTQSPGASRGITLAPIASTDHPSSTQRRNSLHQTRQSKSFSQNLNFIAPLDETAQDPLERWKGQPILRWGPGGQILSTFPKRIPRYGTGQSIPVLKCAPGEVKVGKVKDLLPIEDTIVSFPGPLKPKSKKKEVLAWLSSHIDAFDKQISESKRDFSADYTGQAKQEERCMLWKLMRLLVEHDGALKGNPQAEKAARNIISPHANDATGEAPAWNGNSGSANISVATMAPAQSDAVGSQVLEELRNALAHGDREKAVWQAVDNRLWGHAMLISSTLSNTVWKQVSQEFVRKEVRGAQIGNISLAALYEIFAGNWEESIDELVPASARAGFQMVSAAQGPGMSLNTLDGLDQWRETLLLILSNRSNEDEKAIAALGKLLSGYGRIEAAHICFLFSRSASQFGGADDPQSNFTLVGADHSKQAFEAIKDLDAILLSEVYEYALAAIPAPASSYIPHLQAYKLYHTFALVEYGLRDEAFAYCEALAVAMKSTTRLSPYYHRALLLQTEDLALRLSQSPKDAQSSWMSKPSIEKAKGSLLEKFNSFVAGKDDEVPYGSSGTPENDTGPFARLGSGTPTISRSTSNADLYGYQISQGLTKRPSMGGMNSRYAPSSFASRPAQDNEHENVSLYGSYTSSSYIPDPQNLHPRQSPYEPARSQSGHQLNGGYSPKNSYAAHSNLSSHMALPGDSEQVSSRPHSSRSSEPYVPSVPEDQSSNYQGYSGQAVQAIDPGKTDSFSPAQSETARFSPVQNGYIPEASASQPYVSGYEPPAGGYEPAGGGYQPFSPTTALDDSSQQEATKKKSIMDDDFEADRLVSQADELKKKEEKARKDMEADEAVRRAAEADSARDAEKKKAGGWLGGWFGKKDPSMPTVHKAKLGDESSFFFDPETKKWVNKKAGASAAGAPTTAATPPPPRGGPPMGSSPPSRPPSGPTQSLPLGAPMGGAALPMSRNLSYSGPPSRSDTPLSQSSLGGGDTSAPGAGVTSAAVSGPPSAPPSRPATGMSNASSIDDLLGAPAPRKGGTIKKGKKGGRYIDVMAK